MSALTAIGCLLLLAVVVVGGQVLLGVLGVWAISLPSSSAEWRFIQEYETRSPLSDEQMIREFFSESNIDPQIPIRMRKVFADQLGFQAEKLRPSDDFAAIDGDLDLIEFVVELEEEFDISISTDEALAVKWTLCALSELVQRKLKPTDSSVA